MNTEQQKAEAYVRKEIPEFYKPEFSICSAHKELDADCSVCQAGWLSPQLHQWLWVLNYKFRLKTRVMAGMIWVETIKGEVKFSLTTGQPATEADYKAFNEIVTP